MLLIVVAFTLTGCFCKHVWSEATCTTLATCSECGKTKGELAEHEYSEPTCHNPATCKNCGTTTGDVINHQYSEATCSAPATCVFCGDVIGEALPHQYSEATCSAPKTCAVCGITDGAPLAHKYSEATCQEYAKCTVCGVAKSQKGAHNYVNGVCNVCKAKDPKYDELVKVLKEIERYPTYLKIDCDILDTQIAMYRISSTSSNLLDMVDQVDDMYESVQKIYNKTKNYSEFRVLYEMCKDVEYPNSATTAKFGTFKTQVSRVCEAYDILVDKYK